MPNPSSSADLTELVDELRRDDPPSSATLGRVRERIAVSLTAAPIALAGGATPSKPSPPAPVGPSTWLAGSKAVLVGTLALGAALGAGGLALTRPPEARVVYRERAPSAKAGAAEPVVPVAGAAASLGASPATLPPAPATSRPGSMPPQGSRPSNRLQLAPQPALPAHDDFAAELQVLEQARTALGTGAAGRSLALLDAHAGQHPRGALRQERDALRVRALVEAGRYAEARAAGKLFAANHPDSMLLGSVRAALASIP